MKKEGIDLNLPDKGTKKSSSFARFVDSESECRSFLLFSHEAVVLVASIHISFFVRHDRSPRTQPISGGVRAA